MNNDYAESEKGKSVNKKTILFLSSAVDENHFADLLNRKLLSSSYQAQKFNYLLISGLASIADLIAVSNPPYGKGVDIVINDSIERVGNIEYEIIGVHNGIFRKVINYTRIHKLVKKTLRNKTVDFIVCDAVNSNASLNAVLASKTRNIPVIGIVTDLPIMLSGGKKSFLTYLTNAIIKRCNGYVFLTDEMEKQVNKTHKPYIIMEGLCDHRILQNAKNRSTDGQRREDKAICIYSGSLSKDTGIEILVNSISKITASDIEFHFYGGGELSEYLDNKSKIDSRIVYHGLVSNDVVVNAQRSATLLINPRPSKIVYGNVSFPSKIMEYLASGTPVLSTRLPGIPAEYFDYMYVIEDESLDGYANSIQSAIDDIKKHGFQKGYDGRQFVLNKKNNVIQAERIINLADSLIGGE